MLSFEELRAPRHSVSGQELIAQPNENHPFNYDITKSLVAHNRNLSQDIPGMPDMILRWFSDRFHKCKNVHDAGSGRVHDVLLSAQIAEQHFDKLAELGIAIPRHQNVAIGKDPMHDDAVALYTLVEKIPLKPWDDVNEEFLAQRVFEPIKAYGKWLVDTKQPYMLMDIGWQVQYGLVEASEAQDGYSVYLLDIEPIVGHVAPHALQFLLYESNIKL